MSKIILERPPFRPFDEGDTVRIYLRNLPHWRQDGATYFVTFRLGDAIPLNVIRQWDYERKTWLAARGIVAVGQDVSWQSKLRQLSTAEQARFHRHFDRRLQDFLDRGAGACHLQEESCLGIVREHLRRNDGSGYHLGDFVIMPNHVHLLMVPAAGQPLERILKTVKGGSAVECNRCLGRDGKFWQADSYDHIVRSLDQLQAYRDYIARNPATARISLPPLAYFRAEWMDRWCHE